VPVNAIRAILEEQGFASPRVGYKYSATDEGRLLEIVLPEQSTDDAQLDLDNVTEALNQISVDGGTPLQFTQVQTNSVGGLVGGQFQRKAVMSALLATVAIILYISFRFELAYGVAAVIALLHDVCIAAGIYLLFGRQLSLTVVAALLTIMGYSLNDTIVVFDRIREDLATQVAKSYRQIVNISINETLSRTILTSLTTLIVVITLFLFGGGAINDFALVMLIGVIVGTYSSVFVASAIISTWHKRVKGVNQE
jgi:preprotein translocase SecF subunit